MKQITKGGLAVMLLAGAMALPSLAQQRPGPNGAGDHEGPQAFRAGHGSPVMELAGRLAAQETLMGITPEQSVAWRGYTDALISFAQTGHPGPQHDRPEGGKRPAVAPHDAPAGAKHPDPADRPLMAELVADQAVAKGKSAEQLKAAAATLRAVLSPEQLTRLQQSEGPPPGAGRNQGKAPPPRPAP